MIGRMQCPKCLIGKITYDLDRLSVMCPYLFCYKQEGCTFFVKLEKQSSKTEV